MGKHTWEDRTCTTSRFIGQLHSNPLWILSGYLRELANKTAGCTCSVFPCMFKAIHLGMWYVVCGMWYVVCGMWYVVCGVSHVVWYVLCRVGVVCCVWCVVSNVWRVATHLCSMVCDVCNHKF